MANDHKEQPPKGSGCYAAAVGLLFAGGLVASFFVSVDNAIFLWLLRAWLFIVAVTLMLWGVNRIKNGRPDYFTIGQDTINMVNGIVASTIALLALMFGK